MSPPKVPPGSVVQLSVLGACLVGLVIVATNDWQAGSLCIGIALALGGVLRLLLPEHLAGLLRVRRKLVDTAALGAMSLVVVFMTLTIAARQ
ncbi:MAG: DUF3017 domain-containing protein [Actinomycetota bacterium]|nr:DUF3017 domain-containing protein [Nocardioidaceae bacterium]MDQ3592651.1 DUF3017 domain-containing protein [Actinomycetota bacterium]